MSLLELPPNTLIAGEFRVERPLAQGGMGGVYVARQLSTGQERALKIMHPSLIQDPRLPSARYPSAREAIEALEQLAGARPSPPTFVAATRPPLHAASVPPAPKSSAGKVIAVGGIGLVLLLLLGGGVALAAAAYVFRGELASLVESPPVAPSPASEPSAAAATAPSAVAAEPPAPADATVAKPKVAGARSPATVSPTTTSSPEPQAAAPVPEPEPPAPTEVAASEPPPFNRALAESKVKAAAASAASQCKAHKKPEADVETFTGVRGFGPDGNTTLSFTGLGGSRACAYGIMVAVKYGKYGGKPPFHVEAVPFTITVQ